MGDQEIMYKLVNEDAEQRARLAQPPLSGAEARVGQQVQKEAVQLQRGDRPLTEARVNDAAKVAKRIAADLLRAEAVGSRDTPQVGGRRAREPMVIEAPPEVKNFERQAGQSLWSSQPSLPTDGFDWVAR